MAEMTKQSTSPASSGKPGTGKPSTGKAAARKIAAAVAAEDFAAGSPASTPAVPEQPAPAAPAPESKSPESNPEAGKATAELVQTVKDYALTWYHDGGWDLVVECWSDAEIEETIQGAKTDRGAIRKVWAVIKNQHAHRAEIQAA
jgi:hypothetical protein